nr:MAG TPA: hypothetical protein [Caudoviricetes sp.]
MIMYDFFNNFLDTLTNFINREVQPTKTQSFENKQVKIKLYSSNDFIRFTVYRLDNENSDKQKPQKPELKANTEKCKKLREEFHTYVNRLDKDLFLQICKEHESGTLKMYNTNVENNNTDPELMQKTINNFKSIADRVITEQVTKLKSQMS